MENIKDLYLELAKKVNDNMPNIKHIDLWHNQVGFMEEEHLFPAPAIFMEFRANAMDDKANKAQDLNMQVIFYLFYETMLDTDYHAYNHAGSVAFLDELTNLHKLMHGTSGENYSSMRRVGFAPVDTGTAQNLYQMPFEFYASDVSALVETENNEGENDWQPFQPNFD